MLRLIGLILIIGGAALIFSIPLLGWFFGGMLVFIGISLISIGWLRGLLKGVVPKSIQTCPACKAPIPGDATVCMHCGHRFATA
jgi:hypothetical protein